MSSVMERQIDGIIKIARDHHQEHIGEFYKGIKICLDGHFVAEEILAIYLKMLFEGCKGSHD